MTKGDKNYQSCVQGRLFTFFFNSSISSAVSNGFGMISSTISSTPGFPLKAYCWRKYVTYEIRYL